MLKKIIECVPNFSEGRSKNVIDLITKEIDSVDEVKLLDIDMGHDTNRTVVTFAGPPDSVIEAAYKGIAKAAQLIDMRKHTGAHPRMGATDVCPIIPIENISIEECVELSRKLGKKIAEYNIEHLAPYASQGIPIVCFSPSAGISLKMEYLNVIDNENSRLIADNTYDLHEFLYKLFKNNELNMNFKTINENVGIHLHCHHLVQKVESDVLNLLKLIPGLQVQLVENGCCGVGGSYSFIKNNFDLSLKMGEGLFNTIKNLNQKIYTTGESCMLQLEYGTNQNIGLTTDLLFNAYSLNENSD